MEKWFGSGYRAYQPLSVYWAEQDCVVRSEFRDGNVPADHEKPTVFQEAVDLGLRPRLTGYTIYAIYSYGNGSAITAGRSVDQISWKGGDFTCGQ